MTRKLFFYLLCLFFFINANNQLSAIPKADIDISRMSSSMVYSMVYNLLCSPEKYVGKIIRISGVFEVYENPETHIFYPAVLIVDATACCSSGIEFILRGNPSYPAGYPAPGSEIVVQGRFEQYRENSLDYCHLVDAELEL